MPRDDVQLQFLVGRSFKGKERKHGNTRRDVGSVRSKGSTQSETLSLPQTPAQAKTPSREIMYLSHASTLEDLKKFQLDPRFASTPRMTHIESRVRQKEGSSPHLLR